MSQDSSEVKTNYLSQLENEIVRRYDKYQALVKKQLCTENKKQKTYFGTQIRYI